MRRLLQHRIALRCQIRRRLNRKRQNHNYDDWAFLHLQVTGLDPVYRSASRRNTNAQRKQRRLGRYRTPSAHQLAQEATVNVDPADASASRLAHLPDRTKSVPSVAPLPGPDCLVATAAGRCDKAVRGLEKAVSDIGPQQLTARPVGKDALDDFRIYYRGSGVRRDEVRLRLSITYYTNYRQLWPQPARKAPFSALPSTDASSSFPPHCESGPVPPAAFQASWPTGTRSSLSRTQARMSRGGFKGP